MAEIRRRQRPAQQSSSKASTAEDFQSGNSFYYIDLFCKLLLAVAVILLLVAVIYNLPSPIEAVSFELPSLDDFKEKHGLNDDLTKVKQLFKYEIHFPRTIVDAQGQLYAGLSDGQIIEFSNEKFKRVARFAKIPNHLCDQPKNELICGAITGMSTAPNDSSVLYIADCNRGVFKLDLKAGREVVSVVDTRLPIAGVPPMRMITDLAVLSNGSIFFIDGSSKFGMNESVYELFEAGDNGKLLHYNPANGSVRMVASGLHYPNGVSTSHDESFLLVSESTRFRILKFHLSGPHAGEMTTFAENLPGMPNKISRSSRNGFWVGFTFSRLHANLDYFFWDSLSRTLMFNLNFINYVLSSRQLDGVVVELDEQGDIARFLCDQKGERVTDVFGAWQVGNSLYLVSSNNPFVGLLEIDQ